jgi:predicted ferric reductase
MVISLTGLLAFFLLLLAIIPPLRFTWVDRVFGGLPHAFKLHHLLGLTVGVGAWIHAFYALSPYWWSIENFTDFLLLVGDSENMVFFSGSLALLLLTSTILCSALPIRRRIWLLVHRMGMLSLLAGGLHAVVVWQPIAYTMATPLDWLRLVLAAAFLLVLVMLALHFIHPELLARYRTFTVTKREAIAPGIIRLLLKIDGTSPAPWKGGEFVYVHFDCRGPCGVSHERHPFTITAVPQPHELELVIKAVGDDTTRIQEIALGTTGEISGPYGAFKNLLALQKPQVWIGGGLGILPFLGLLRQMTLRQMKTLTKLGEFGSELGTLTKFGSDLVLIYLYYLQLFTLSPIFSFRPIVI